MGVKGLWSLLEPLARPVKLESLSQKRLAIDASIWIYQFLKAVRDKEGNVIRNSHIIGFFRRIVKLLFYGIKPIFVFDGVAPVLKRRTIANRKERREGRREATVNAAGKLLFLQMQQREKEKEQAEQLQQQRNDEIDENVVYYDQINNNNNAPLHQTDGTKDGKDNVSFAYKRKDQYDLPPLSTDLAHLIDESDLRLPLPNSNKEDASNFDSETFASLPANERYHLLNNARLRSRLRMGLSKDQLKTIYPDTLSFSRFQIERVRLRNDLTQRVMIAGGLSESRRIASERGKEYVLVRGENGFKLGHHEGGTLEKAIEVDRPLNQTFDTQKLNMDEENGESEESGDFEEVELDENGKKLFIQSDDDDDEDENEIDNGGLFISEDEGDDSDRDAVYILPPDDTVAESSATNLNIAKPSTPLNAKDTALDSDESAFEWEASDEENDNDTNEDANEAIEPATKKIVDNEDDSNEIITDRFIAIKEVPKPDETAEDEFDMDMLNDLDPTQSLLNMAQPDEMHEVIKDRPAEDIPLEIAPKIDVPKTPVDEPVQVETLKDIVPEAVKPAKQPRDSSELDNVVVPKLDTTLHTEPKRKKSSDAEIKSVDSKLPENFIENETSPKAAEATVLPKKKQKSKTSKSAPAEPSQGSTFDLTTKKTQETTPTPTSLNIMPDKQKNSSKSTKVKSVTFQDKPSEAKATSFNTAPLLSPSLQDIPTSPTSLGELADQLLSVDPSTPPIKIEEPEIQYFPSQNSGPVILDDDHNIKEEDKYFDTSDEENDMLMSQLAVEAEEHNRFAAELRNNAENAQLPPAETREDFEKDLRALRQQMSKDKRDADEVTQVMINECKELLALFGLPFIVAPAEAEAQCAELVTLGLVDGIVTDDSDVFLFGGNRVYKNVFNQAKYVECYLSTDLDREFKLDRAKLIRLAHLLGSDYTEGLPSVGPVTALEILADFPGENGLSDFKTWWDTVQTGTDTATTTALKKKLRKQATKIFLPPLFPDQLVNAAYTHPEVDKDPSNFQWGIPDLDALRRFLMNTIGWSPERTDEILLPVLRDMNKRQTVGQQRNLTDFFAGQTGAGAFAPRHRDAFKSKRMYKAMSNILNQENSRMEDQDELEADEANSPSSPEKKKKSDAKGKSPQKRKKTKAEEHTAGGDEIVHIDDDDDDDDEIEMEVLPKKKGRISITDRNISLNEKDI